MLQSAPGLPSFKDKDRDRDKDEDIDKDKFSQMMQLAEPDIPSKTIIATDQNLRVMNQKKEVFQI